MKKISALLFFLAALAPLPLRALDVPAAGGSYAYPLPAALGGYVNIVYSMASSGRVKIMVYNEAGDEVIHFDDTKPAGLQSSPVYLCCLSPGIYIYWVSLQYDSGGSAALKPAKFVVTR
jgi:hypothetical protein